ncbi:MAG: dienelactone hydrolase family protein [Haloferacaceae archaeon]
MSLSRAVPVIVVGLVLMSGCSEAPLGTETPTAETERSPTPTPEPTAAGAAYETTPHVGCQPGAIRKDGTCRVAVSGTNAEIFDAENLSAITATRTTVGDTPGYLARPAANGTYPAVVVIHEWWGLNENVEHMADVLAGHGYVVFAVDLYDGRVATNSSEAAALSGEVRANQDAAVATMGRAVAGLRDAPYTTDQVASLGWCFGGGQSLQLSLSGADLNATVVYYGTLTTNRSTLRHVDGPVLGIFGAEDPVVDVATVHEFDRALGDLGVEREIHVYEGASHAFANPSGERFHPEATRDAWATTLRFLDENLKG